MKTKLGEIVEKIQTGPFGSQLHRHDYTSIGTPVIMPQDIVNWRISTERIVYVDNDTVERLSRHKVSINDIIYPRRGDVSKCAIIGKSESNWLCGTGCLKITIDPSKANPKYVFYFLQQEKIGKWIVGHATGATMLNINSKTLNELPLDLPELSTQNKIIEILSAYDDMIDTCKQQIALLEEAAQRLYREWFVDMRFPGHETTPIGENGLPEGWKRTTIFPFCTTVLGGTPSRKNADFWGGKIPWINSGAVNQNRIIEPTEYITEVAIARSATKLMPKHTTLLAITGATLGQVSFTEIPVCGNQSIIGVIPPETEYEEFIHLTILNEIDTIISPAGGSAQQHINKDMLNKYAIIVPNKEIILKFKEVINPYYQMVSDIYGKLQGCRLLKDMLLPRLISGQIKINA